MQCHNGGKQPWNRAELTTQQLETIQFLIQNHQMPPKGFQLSEAELNEVQDISRNLHK